ncbi:hypothetical protein BH11ACT5_BH11ACT5_25730 [soil metagenome]
MVTYADPGTIEFDAVIYRPDATGASSFVDVPFDVQEAFGAGRVPVAATFDGEPYRGSLIPSRHDGHRILVVADVQQAIGKAPGDAVHVAVRLDTAERVVELDADVEAALEASGSLEQFRALAYSHQKEFWLWVNGAKKPETRQARVVKMQTMLAEGLRLK